ncbi:MAG: SapC family protein [Pseudomonadales bacterium]|jgi:hypothetical protein
MSTLLFYDKPVALNKNEHKNLKIKASTGDYSFAAKTNSVILAGVEFSEAAKEYPIVFAKAGDSLVPVALLGLRNEENLFVDEAGAWDARYIPAFVRRYPFVLAETGEATQRMVCIDEGFSGFNDKEGEALFDGEEPTAFLQQAIDFLEEYQRQYLRTEQFLKRLKELDLLKELNAKVDMADGQQFGLSGLMVVDEKKLLELNDEQALAFFRSGELAWVYCHLMSIGSLGSMIDRVARVTAKAGSTATKK